MPYSVAEWKDARQKGRTNLLYLCQNILGYPDVSKEVHGRLCASLQRFKGGSETVAELPGGRLRFEPGSYKPYVDMWDLEGPRKTLILIPRGHLKTTVATIAHTIQWIINYPNIRILLSSGTGEQVRKFISEVKGHFQFNEMFRYFYPEFCPHGKNVKEFGNQDSF